MKAIDMTPIIKKYPGLFVALSMDRKTVFGKGRTAEEALQEARKKGNKESLVTKIPLENRSYLL